tara:strand:- start:500 stop:694 length:195 start_codon:yes stop_codon:yes gene_type:complete
MIMTPAIKLKVTRLADLKILCPFLLTVFPPSTEIDCNSVVEIQLDAMAATTLRVVPPTNIYFLP